MPRHFVPKAGDGEQQRKFINPTPFHVGANIFGPDGKPDAIPIEPGGSVWLTATEERMTAEAPRLPHDNPFVKEWTEVLEVNSDGEPIRQVVRQGVLVLDLAEARPAGPQRFVPPRMERVAGDQSTPDKPEEIVGSPNAEPGPAPEGKPAPGEVEPVIHEEELGGTDTGGDSKVEAATRPKAILT
jgi:hypothetical protein